MAREDPHFRLRIPEDLKLRVERAAHTNRRSINAEIIARLEQSFPAEPISSLPGEADITDDEAKELVEAIFRTIDRYKKPKMTIVEKTRSSEPPGITSEPQKSAAPGIKTPKAKR